MFHVLTGDAWPAVDEDEINDLAQLWLAAGNELMQIAPEVTRSARWLADSGALVGDAQKALAAAVGVVTGDGDLALAKLAAAYEELGNYLHGVAVQTQYMKIIVIEELIILAAQILYLLAMIPWTFGASAAGIAALQVFGRQFALTLMQQLVIAVATGEVLQLGLDAIAQFAQIMERQTGHSIGRTEWDKNLTKSAAITGVIGGALGPLMAVPGSYLGRGLGRVLGGMLGENAGHEAGHWAADTFKGGVHEWLTDGLSGLAQEHKWTPDTFSTTAGALDEGISGLAGIGGRKGGHRYYTGMLGGVGVPDPKIHVPDHLATGRLTSDLTGADSLPTLTRVAGFPAPTRNRSAGPLTGTPAPTGIPAHLGDGTPGTIGRFLTSAPADVPRSADSSGTAAASVVARRDPDGAPVERSSAGASVGSAVAGPVRLSEAVPSDAGTSWGAPAGSPRSARPEGSGVPVPEHPAESALPSFLPPAVQAKVSLRVRSVLDRATGPAPEATLARLVALDAVQGLQGRHGPSLPEGARAALTEASASMRRAVVGDLVQAGRERSARDAAARPEREAAMEAERQAERRSLWAAELHATLAEDPQAALAMLQDRQPDAGRADPAEPVPPPADAAGEVVAGDDPQSQVRGLPAELGRAVDGLAPLAQRVVVSGLPVQIAVRLLERMRDTLVDVALTQPAQAGAGSSSGAAAHGADQLRAELIRRWDGGPGVVPGMAPVPWTSTLAEARAASDLLRPADDPTADGPTSVPVNAVTTRVEAFADAFAAVVTGSIGASISPGLDAGVSVFEAQLARDVALTNPAWDPAVGETTSNCVHVVNGYELRRRGYDVQARPLPEHLVPYGGRTVEEIELAWRRPFVRVTDLDALEQAFAEPGSRGIVDVVERQGAVGSGHVFNVENVNGEVRYLDAQRSVSDARFFFTAAERVRYLRVGHLAVSWTHLDEFVEPADPSSGPLPPLVADPTADGRAAYDAFAHARVQAELDGLPPVVASALPAELPPVHRLVVARQVMATLAPLPQSARDAAWAHLATSEVLARAADQERHRYTEPQRRAFQDAVLRTLEPAILDDLAALAPGRVASRQGPGSGPGEAASMQGLPPMISRALQGVPAMVDRIVNSGMPVDTGARLLERLHQTLHDGARYEAHARTGNHARTANDDARLTAALTRAWNAAPDTRGRGKPETWTDTLIRARTIAEAVPGGVQPVNAATRRAHHYAEEFAQAYTRAVGGPPAPAPAPRSRRPGPQDPQVRLPGSADAPDPRRGRPVPASGEGSRRPSALHAEERGSEASSAGWHWWVAGLRGRAGLDPAVASNDKSTVSC
jgi:hypothetical protein